MVRKHNPSKIGVGSQFAVLFLAGDNFSINPFMAVKEFSFSFQ